MVTLALGKMLQIGEPSTFESAIFFYFRHKCSDQWIPLIAFFLSKHVALTLCEIANRHFFRRWRSISGKVSSTIGCQDPSVSKSNRSHIDTFRVSIINLRRII
jgi:hypothetical protein